MNLIANMSEEQIRQLIREEISRFIKSDKYVFDRMIQILDGKNIQTGRTYGTKIGTATDQKIGFYGTTPVDKPATVNDPAGGLTVDSEARTAINAIIDRLQELGLIS